MKIVKKLTVVVAGLALALSTIPEAQGQVLLPREVQQVVDQVNDGIADVSAQVNNGLSELSSQVGSSELLPGPQPPLLPSE